MIIDDEIIKKLALLARLNPSNEEMEQLKTNIPTILKQFDKLSKLDTTWVKAISQITWLENITREDTEIPCEFSSKLTSQAPSQSDNWSFLVKNVL